MTIESPRLIAHIVYSFNTGGLENGLVNIINRTPRERYRHVIICLTSGQDFSSRITVPGVDVVELHKRDGKDLAIYWKLLRCLRRIRPSIIHSRNLAALDVQVLGVFLPGVKQVHGEHGRDIYDLDGSNWKYRMLRKFMRVFVDQYITVSKDLERWLLQSIAVKPQNLTQIYNGVDFHNFRPESADDRGIYPSGFLGEQSPVLLGTVGRLAGVKDQALILRAVDQLLREKPQRRDQLRVVLVGDGPLRSELTLLVNELGISDITWMAGDRSDVPQLLQTLDIFVLPSLAEGISNTILEAMSTGLPVIATDTGGNPELVEHGVNGLLFPVGDSSALAECILSLLENPERRAAMGEYSVSTVRAKFDWGVTVQGYMNVYDKLLGLNASSGQTNSRSNMEVR